MTPKRLLQELFVNDFAESRGRRFGLALTEVSKAIAEFEADPHVDKLDVHYFYDKKNPNAPAGHEIALRRSPGLAIVVIRERHGEVLAMLCQLVADRFSIERVVITDSDNAPGCLKTLVRTACGGELPFRFWEAPDAGTFREDWLQTYGRSGVTTF